MGYGWGSSKTIKRHQLRLEKWAQRKAILDKLINEAGGVALYAKKIGLETCYVYAMSRGDRPISDKAIGN